MQTLVIKVSGVILSVVGGLAVGKVSALLSSQGPGREATPAVLSEGQSLCPQEGPCCLRAGPCTPRKGQ